MTKEAIEALDKIAAVLPLDRWGFCRYHDEIKEIREALQSLPEAQEPLRTLCPEDEEAFNWVVNNCMAIRRDNGSMEYTVTAVVRAYQAGQANATRSVGVTVSPEVEKALDDLKYKAAGLGYSALFPFVNRLEAALKGVE